MRVFLCLLLVLWAGGLMAGVNGVLQLYPGYVTRVQCEGRLLVSAVGNDALVRLEALPKELGCGILLKPTAGAGRTNLILETTAGSVERVLHIESSKTNPLDSDLHFSLKGVSR